MGVRSEIQQLVAELEPFDDIEQEHIDFVLKWIESGCEIFRRAKPATPETHLVSYFVVVSPELDQILLVDHKKSGLWLPPGGHVEPDEDPIETVRREAKEELGIEAEFLFDEPLMVTVTGTVGNVARHTDVSLWYVLQGDPKVSLNYDADEFNQIRWFKTHEIPYNLSDPHMQRFMNKLNLRVKSIANSI